MRGSTAFLSKASGEKNAIPCQTSKKHGLYPLHYYAAGLT